MILIALCLCGWADEGLGGVWHTQGLCLSLSRMSLGQPGINGRDFPGGQGGDTKGVS